MILQTKPAVAVPLPSGFFLPKAPKTIPIREVKIPIKLTKGMKAKIKDKIPKIK